MLSGSYEIGFEEARAMKKGPVKYHEIEDVYLAGRICCLKRVANLYDELTDEDVRIMIL